MSQYKEILLDNIAYLLKKKGLKIGDFEEKVGVSLGYLSRGMKENNKTNPGIDFAINASQVLSVSLDALLEVRLRNLTETEQYLVSFFSKLRNDTIIDKISWEKQTKIFLNNTFRKDENYAINPLFKNQSVEGEHEYDAKSDYKAVYFNSKTYGWKTEINGNCFKCDLHNGSYIYLMNTTMRNKSILDESRSIEVWIIREGLEETFLAATMINERIKKPIDELYVTIEDCSDHLNISEDTRRIIDSFMKD